MALISALLIIVLIKSSLIHLGVQSLIISPTIFGIKTLHFRLNTLLFIAKFQIYPIMHLIPTFWLYITFIVILMKRLVLTLYVDVIVLLLRILIKLQQGLSNSLLNLKFWKFIVVQRLFIRFIFLKRGFIYIFNGMEGLKGSLFHFYKLIY